MSHLESGAEARFFAAAEFAAEFLMQKSSVHRALERLITALDQAGIAYAIVGALALGEYGYRRTTEDVDVLLTLEGLEAFKAAYLGRGWVEKFAGSKGMRDTVEGVGIDVLLTGDFPGDGLPKPIAFPDPADAARQGERVALLPIERLLELKLASGISAPHRLRDLADVLEVIRLRGLDAAFGDRLDPYVREKYLELCRAAETAPGDEG